MSEDVYSDQLLGAARHTLITIPSISDLAFFSYVMRHNELKLNETPNYNFLGHPINAFHFVRHVASGWTDVRQNVISDDVISLKEDFGKNDKKAEISHLCHPPCRFPRLPIS